MSVSDTKTAKQKSTEDKVSLQKSKQLAELYTEAETQAASASLPLAQKAEDIVPGEGSPTAHVLFIGEAPGEQEAKQRRPFVGRSGQLLRKHIAEIGLDSSYFYIANVVKVRPPENRDPSLDEIEAYRPFLEKEIEIISPRLIATLGRFSMAAFLPDVKISQVHGRLHRVTYNEQKYYVLPLYHPAAALRNGNMLASFQEDIKKIPKILEWIESKVAESNEAKSKEDESKEKQSQNGNQDENTHKQSNQNTASADQNNADYQKNQQSKQNNSQNERTQNLESEIIATLLQ